MILVNLATFLPPISSSVPISSEGQIYFQSFENRKIQNSDISGTLSVRSPSACALACLLSGTCLQFSFSSDSEPTANCQLAVTEEAGTVEATHYAIYRKTGITEQQVTMVTTEEKVTTVTTEEGPAMMVTTEEPVSIPFGKKLCGFFDQVKL